MTAIVDNRARERSLDPSRTRKRAPVVAMGLLGLGLAIVALLHARGVIASWEPLPIITENGWILPPVPATMPELDVIGFSAVALTGLLMRSSRTFAAVCGVAILVEAASAVLRWTMQYARLGATSTVFVLITVVAVALLPQAIKDLDDARGRRPKAARSEDGAQYLVGVGGILIGLAMLLFADPAAPKAALQGRSLGALVATIGTLALVEQTRAVRWGNALLGGFLLVAPLALGYTLRGAIQSMTFGLVLLVVSVALGEGRDEKTAH